MVVIRIGVLPWCKVFGWEKGSETSLEHIWASANCVRGVAVVGALAYDIMITIMIIMTITITIITMITIITITIITIITTITIITMEGLT